MKKKKKRQGKRICCGDKVMVIAGNDKGRVGEVLHRSEDRAVVQGVNVRKKAIKRSEANQQGGFQDLETSIHVSNLTLCDQDDNPIKVGVRMDEDGKRELVYKKDGQELVYRSVRQRP